MTTITLKINERSKAGKTFLSLVNFFSEEKNGVEIIEPKEKIPNEETQKAIHDAKKGKVYRAENLEDLMQHLNS